MSPKAKYIYTLGASKPSGVNLRTIKIAEEYTNMVAVLAGSSRIRRHARCLNCIVGMGKCNFNCESMDVDLIEVYRVSAMNTLLVARWQKINQRWICL